MTIDERLERIESRLAAFQAAIAALLQREPAREWYTTEEFARAVGLSELTIREHCRLGRLGAVKRQSGRAPHRAWAISRRELLRYQQHGLLPATPAELTRAK
ncbi:MAG TPA: helix-turn-helix domain-containing protein [Pirellulales bacterium]|nr:helix-turn-helix domain-containing protein [Pirellulales bacterium]